MDWCYVHGLPISWEVAKFQGVIKKSTKTWSNLLAALFQEASVNPVGATCFCCVQAIETIANFIHGEGYIRYFAPTRKETTIFSCAFMLFMRLENMG